MRFSVEHTFPAAPAAVLEILFDPGFHRELELPDLGPPEVVEEATEGSARVLRLRYEFIGHLDPVARKLLAGRSLTWLQDLRLDVVTVRGTLQFAAEADANRLHGEASIVFKPQPDGSTVRAIDGHLHVRVPVIGGSAERRIVPGLLTRMDVEAAALARALEGHG